MTRRSKALSTEQEAAPEAPATPPAQPEPEPPAEATDAPPDLTGVVSGRIAKLGGFMATVAAIDAERKARKLPSLTSKDYRWVLGRPGGIPFSFPVTVIYKPESPDEQALGTYRIGR
ncbi:hypothetical protein [Nodosilinea sp. E11]|uniref:hypothetical protein n=1 Tax=Nodosilinea sp. E11 TaxID=3037479 RepID=UPI0029351579|nr:hypothetical protein [Nodosilinea sp. E11]WOD37373.1 hypothetical protein RRF56_02650 [Nodosilinea sp. E11]WOD37935.1 hypothetical protein RRF56_17115 [Nodosilinea sp. E11]